MGPIKGACLLPKTHEDVNPTLVAVVVDADATNVSDECCLLYSCTRVILDADHADASYFMAFWYLGDICVHFKMRPFP